jgi:hypothetical protein
MSLPPGGKGFEKAGGERPSCAESWKHPQSSQYSNNTRGTRTRSERKADGHAGTRKSHIVGLRDRDD